MLAVLRAGLLFAPSPVTSSNLASGQDVVSGAHTEGDTGLMTLGDTTTYARAKGVLDTGDSHDRWGRRQWEKYISPKASLRIPSFSPW